jgi:hypothetical protein
MLLAAAAVHQGVTFMKLKLSAALVGAASVLWLSVGCAHANTVTIGLQQDGVNGGAITTVATGDGLANVAGLTYGTFTSVSVTGLATPGAFGYSHFFSDVIAASSTTPGTLTVYVTVDGARLPHACSGGVCAPPLFIGFTVNTLPMGNLGVSLGWTVQEEVSFQEDFLLASWASPTFSSIDTSQLQTSCGNLRFRVCENGTLTEKYIIGATGSGVAVATILVETPAPVIGAGVPGLILASAGLLGWRRRRHA